MGLLSQVEAATGGGGCVLNSRLMEGAWHSSLVGRGEAKIGLMLPKGSNHTAFYGLCVYGRDLRMA